MRATIPLAVVGILLSSMFILPVCENVSAGTTAYYMTWGPSAYNSTYWRIYSRYSSGQVDSLGVRGGGDSLNQSMAWSTGVDTLAATNDFSNTTWVDPGVDGIYPEYDDILGTLPPWNATVLTVTVFAHFLGDRPSSKLYYTLDGNISWTTSSTYYPGENQIWWNVTSLESWTPDMLNSTDVWVKIRCTPVTGYEYYLDYLGWIITWSLPYGGSGEEPPEGPGESEWSFNILEGNNLIGIFGLVGFIGMIVCPAAAIWFYKNGDEDAISTFVKLLAAFTFCFALFLFYVNA